MKNKGKIIALALLSSLLLSGCQGSPFDSDDFLSRISFNLWDFLATFLAFIVLLLVAFFFGYKPIKGYIKRRSNYVEGKIKTAEKREIDSRGLVEEAEKTVADSKKSAILIVDKAKEDANIRKAEIIEQAKEEANQEKAKAKQDIAREVEASKDDIHREIVSVAMNASKKVLGREINEEDNARLVDDFVKDLDKEGK
jgi:F-type H+-transporting ATPase subunit b